MICVPTLVGWKKGTGTIHSYFRVVREAKNGDESKEAQQLEAVYQSSLCSCPHQVYPPFSKTSSTHGTYSVLTITLACSYISPCDMAWFLPRDITLFQMFPCFWYCKTAPLRECAILFMALIELEVPAYWNHFWYPSMLSVPWSIQTFSSMGCSKLMNLYSIALSQVCYKEPLAVGKILPNPETFCPRPASWQQFSPKFHNSVQSFIFWFDIIKIPSASTFGQFRKHWKKCWEQSNLS